MRVKIFTKLQYKIEFLRFFGFYEFNHTLNNLFIKISRVSTELFMENEEIKNGSVGYKNSKIVDRLLSVIALFLFHKYFRIKYRIMKIGYMMMIYQY